MRGRVTRDDLRRLMKEIARAAPGRRPYRVYFVGGGTAVWSGWRDSTIDVDLAADDDAVLRDVQRFKERLQMNIEFARPEDFVPPLRTVATPFANSVASTTTFRPFTSLARPRISRITPSGVGFK